MLLPPLCHCLFNKKLRNREKTGVKSYVFASLNQFANVLLYTEVRSRSLCDVEVPHHDEGTPTLTMCINTGVRVDVWRSLWAAVDADEAASERGFSDTEMRHIHIHIR